VKLSSEMIQKVWTWAVNAITSSFSSISSEDDHRDIINWFALVPEVLNEAPTICTIMLPTCTTMNILHGACPLPQESSRGLVAIWTRIGWMSLAHAGVSKPLRRS